MACRDDLPPADLLVLHAALRQIEQLDLEVSQLEAEVIRQGKKLKGVRLLLQVHGLNLLSAIALLAEVGDIALFETSKQLVSYAGLATSTKQSSETVRHGWITKRGRKRLAHGLHPNGASDGQSHGDAADGVLPEEEA